MGNPFTNWTEADVALYNARKRPLDANATPSSAGCEKESELHQQILDECRKRGWLPLHGSMAHRAFRTSGEFDFTILADGGQVYLIECKTRTGKLSPEQQGIHAWARKLGHAVHVVRSIEEFLSIGRSILSE